MVLNPRQDKHWQDILKKKQTSKTKQWKWQTFHIAYQEASRAAFLVDGEFSSQQLIFSQCHLDKFSTPNPESSDLCPSGNTERQTLINHMCCRANIPTQRATVILFWSQTISKHHVFPDFVVLNIALCHNRGDRYSHLELLESTHKKPIGNLGKKAYANSIRRCPMSTKDTKTCLLLWHKWTELHLYGREQTEMTEWI